jgi:hypothetical protein
VPKQFRGIDYRFHFRHTSGRSKVNSVTVNGKAPARVDGEYKIPLPARRPRKPVQVEM